ncbi:hypothetical protein ACMD2_24840 [Ananas comosus]|uniref:Uncharacterized protein n=1 Tax=Ananas comosus TaxID=4615 RepID=A0A199VV72_ANACO|nr:hypothetical protein ACMD2_24840 [Ananas comosus]
MSTPTWLSSMSWKSGLRIASSSMATTWLVAVPLLLMLNKPKYSADRASEKFVEGVITKAIPWPPRSAYSGLMAKAKVLENEGMLPSEIIKRPSEDTVTEPSRVRLAPENPLKVKRSSAGEEASSLKRRRRRKKRKDEYFNSMDGYTVLQTLE